MNTLFDTHAHLTDADRDPAAYLARAEAAGVGEILFCSSGLENSERNAAFAASSEHFYFAAGVHPHDAETMTEDFSIYKKFASAPRLIAVGELGLDYFYDISPRERQMSVFRGFLELALEMDLPAIVHCRDKDGADEAYRDCFELLAPFASAGGRFELHAFAGTPAWLEKFASLGAVFGVGGMLTFKRAENIREVVALMPRDRVMLETDSPYLAPVPHRGETNHPALLPYTARALAVLYSMSLEKLTDLTTENAHRFFRIGGAR